MNPPAEPLVPPSASPAASPSAPAVNVPLDVEVERALFRYLEDGRPRVINVTRDRCTTLVGLDERTLLPGDVPPPLRERVRLVRELLSDPVASLPAVAAAAAQLPAWPADGSYRLEYGAAWARYYPRNPAHPDERLAPMEVALLGPAIGQQVLKRSVIVELRWLVYPEALRTFLETLRGLLNPPPDELRMAPAYWPVLRTPEQWRGSEGPSKPLPPPNPQPPPNPPRRVPPPRFAPLKSETLIREGEGEDKGWSQEELREVLRNGEHGVSSRLSGRLLAVVDGEIARLAAPPYNLPDVSRAAALRSLLLRMEKLLPPPQPPPPSAPSP